jgi:hypothetical protein
MRIKNVHRLLIAAVVLVLSLAANASAQKKILAEITVSESSGLERDLEYVEFPLQIPLAGAASKEPELAAIDKNTDGRIACQIMPMQNFPAKNLRIVQIIFPLSMQANAVRTFELREEIAVQGQKPNISMRGTGLDLIIENQYYRADLSRRSEPEPKTHASGQLQELLIKMGFNQLLTNAEDRVHWAPNFKREELEWYTTIAHWENPKEYKVNSGDYLIQTFRRDTAPDHPEIMLTAVYNFYAGLPFFTFYSEMEFIQDLPLELLRNDEMTTDSMFTHLVFQRPTGEVVEVQFKDRYKLLEEQPIEDDAPWICFYNIEEGFAFGSIRLRYDNYNRSGELSPTYLPHTAIGEWLDRKYWNRRLIHDHLVGIPAGSRYIEENAYLVFKIGEADRLEAIKRWAGRLSNPLKVSVHPGEEM